MSTKPPKWADRLLERFCRADLLEEIQGDLHESFYWRTEAKGSSFAKRQFIKEALLSFKISNLKPYDKMDRLLTLTKSHLKTGWRFLWKTKAYSSINIVGLSIGIVFSWFAYLYAFDEFDYNKHMPDAENIYRMTTTVSLYDNMINLSGNSQETIQRIEDEMPEIKNVARFSSNHAEMKLPEGSIDQEYLMAEKTLLEFLNLEFVEGKPGAFDAPNEVVISEKLAYKLGIRGEAVNAEIELLDTTRYVTFKVLGVYKEIPIKSSIQTDLILPFSFYLSRNDSDNFDVSTLLQVHSTTNFAELSAGIKEIMNPSELENEYFPKLISMADLHLSGENYAINGFLPGGNLELIWFIVAAGVMCLLISVINYSNFSISLYINRAREVAVRKIIGSANSGVFQQLMTESFLTTLLSAALAVILFIILSPHFSLLVEKQYGLPDLINLENLPALCLIIVFISVLSGFYPSILLSKLKILKSLKGEQKVGKSVFVTKSLLIVQFSISIIMIASMLIFKGQLSYLLNFDRGYDVTNVIKINIPGNLIGRGTENVLANKLTSIPDIRSITVSGSYGMNAYDDGENKFSLTFKNIDNTYIDVMSISLLDGQTLQQAKDNGIANGVLVNQSFLDKSGITEDPLGKSIPFLKSSIIVGVVKDFHAFGPKSEMSAMLFFDVPDRRQVRHVFIKSDADRVSLNSKLSEIWEDIYGPIPLKYDYMETLYRDRFEQEEKISKIAGLGSIIAIFISAFGLLGLVGLTIQRKLKELSIRRVLGAENLQIIWMMLKKFAIPIGISLVLGISLSMYLTEQWLSDYHYRISFGWTHGAIAAISVIAILSLIIVAHTMNVTRTNPVVHLKDE